MHRDAVSLVDRVYELDGVWHKFLNSYRAVPQRDQGCGR